MNDTICALASAPVHAALAVIRISGPDTLRVVSSIVAHAEKCAPRRAVYSPIVFEGVQLDDAVVTFYKSPASFTGEDTAEIVCHGNPLVARRILDAMIQSGARHAEPGEFTKRAFLNGKMDLTAAEAINHIIMARSSYELDAAMRQMHGLLKNAVNEIRDALILIKADVEGCIDFSAEDIEFISSDEGKAQSDKLVLKIEHVLTRCRIGEHISHGIDIPIVGKPNVGKSSILNLILNTERAIVSDIPGTTRDLIKETVQIAGIPVNLIDTAGIDTPGSEIERLGIERSTQKIESAPLVVMVIDAARGLDDVDRKILERVAGKKTIFLANKMDVAGEHVLPGLAESVGRDVIAFSAKTGLGLKQFEDAVSDILKHEYAVSDDSFAADARVTALLEKARDAANLVSQLFSNHEPPEIIAFQIQLVIDSLCEITGEISPDDVLNSIFSRFCIGK